MDKKIRTRFAPSPTGFLHVGGMRTALFAWLVARQAGGEFVLRIEDTDRQRHVEGAGRHIIECLDWLGLDYDEGPIYQSQRVKDGVYKKWAQKLIESGRAYADPYSTAEVQKFREEAQKNKQPFLYRNHRPDNPTQWDGSTPLRFRTRETNWNIKDEITLPQNEKFAGLTNYSSDSLDDFILIKSDGYPTYNFAHIVDDIEMGITDVIRGQEFLSSMPNYYELYTALNEEIPRMYTMPHVLAEDGKRKLSKRDGAKDILDYRKDGYLPEAMVNFLATLGWNDGTEQEIFTAKQLIEKFDLSRVQKGGAHFDERRLKWLNGAHIRSLSIEELYKKVENYWPDSAKDSSEKYQIQVLDLVQERLKFFAELAELSSFFFQDLPINPKLISGHKQLKKFSNQELKRMLEQAKVSLEQSDFKTDDLQERLNQLLEQTGEKPAVLFSLIRIATTQSPASPALAETMSVLGKEICLTRIEQQIKRL